jgi:hypothetical protein
MIEKSKSKGKSQAVQDETALMWAIGFTPMDLAVNQDGILSDYQRKKFRILRRKNLLSLLSCVLVAIAVLALRQVWVSPVNSLCLLIPILLCGLIALGAIINIYKYHRDVTQNRVDAVQGRINLNIMDKTRYTTYTMNVQNQRWVVEKDILLAFKNGDPYAIYYAPHSKIILSAEWLREGDG